MSDKNKVKRPHMNHGLKEYFPEELPAHELVVKITDADELFAALERRARIAERALKNARDYASRLQERYVNGCKDDSVEEYLADATIEIDAELAQEGR